MSTTEQESPAAAAAPDEQEEHDEAGDDAREYRVFQRTDGGAWKELKPVRATSAKAAIRQAINAGGEAAPVGEGARTLAAVPTRNFTVVRAAYETPAPRLRLDV